MEQSSDRIRINICTLDSQNLTVNAHKDMLVSELKNAIYTQSRIPFDKQRLIFKGKILKNTDNLAGLNIDNNSILQLVANLNHASDPRNDAERNSASELLRLAITGNQAASLLSRSRRQTRREISNTERIETIRQNIQTVESLVRSMNTTINEGEPQGFNLNTRNFVIGQ